ncbi:hypothetical protein K1719_028846 [Acacia pycnantha]|nr:hypothetical protein K1719_028846 [Acacia pycnantha]
MEKVAHTDEADEMPALHPPISDAPYDAEPKLAVPIKYSVVSRRGFGTMGKHMPVLANQFQVSVGVPDAVFFQYSVSITSENDRAVESKGIRRKLIDRLYQTYSSELGGKRFAYDGGKTLYAVGPLPHQKLEFTVVLEESLAKRSYSSPGADGNPSMENKRSKHSFKSTTFNVNINFAAEVPLRSVAFALEGVESDSIGQDALRVLDTILRQQAASMSCLLVRQSFFRDDSRNFTDVGGGVTRVQGFHSSFHTTQGGLFLNMDVSTTMILTPGPVINFLLSNQNVREPRYIDWAKAKRMLKNLRVRASHRNHEFKIIGLSEKPCNQQLFCMKVKNSEGSNGVETVDITVYEYFAKHCGIELTSAYLPCLDVGKPKRPVYLPMELCSLIPLQRYTKALSPMQRASLVEKSRQKPRDRIKTITDAMAHHNYDDDPVLAACGISIKKQFTQVEGRVLETPKLKVGKNDECFPRNGRWNFNNKTLLQPAHIEHWAVVNFSARCDTSYLSRELIKCGMNKGIKIERPYTLIEEDSQIRRSSPVARVEKMFELLYAKLLEEPDFILCVLPERKNCDIYGPWKKKCLTEVGVITQCISPLKINDQYLTNVLLKINSKLGGINSMLAIEHCGHVPLINDTPTLILGMDVSHGSPGQSDLPSIAAVVGSRCWPLISRYRASVRTQSSKAEMIDALYKPLEDGKDDGMIRELLLDFYHSSNGRKPSQIIVFRDGVSESQFNQVLNIELDQIIKAYQHLGDADAPKFTVIVAQKNHHTKLFHANGSENVPPGTVVDTQIVHPRNYDFFLCSHAGNLGTPRPAHYHVLLDEIGFSADDLQNLIHSLSYVYQRSTAATSVVAPICYAHLAAAQMRQFLKSDDSSETPSILTTELDVPIPELPRLHHNVQSSMFFC